MEKHYRFAGVELTVDIPDPWMYEDDGHLAPFRVAQVKDPHYFRFAVVDALSEPSGGLTAALPDVLEYKAGNKRIRYIGGVRERWEESYLRVEYGEREHHVQVKPARQLNRVGVKMVLNALAAEHLVTGSDGFIFHCSYIVRNGSAILFTAPSGTGKSTQAELWRKYRGAEIINGDRAAVRYEDGKLMAEGIPFAGSSEYCKNASLPVAAIVYLAQAPQNSIRKMRGYEAFSRIWEGISVNTWSKADMERISEVVEKAAQEIPVYYLACTPDESAVITLEEALRKQEIV